MFNATKIFTPCTSVSNWFQSTSNIILESSQKNKHLGMTFNFYNRPHKDYNFEKHSTKENGESSLESTISTSEKPLNNNFCYLNSYQYRIGNTLERNLKKNKPDCDENIESRYYKHNHKEKCPQLKIKNKKKKNSEYKNIFKMSAKHKSLVENSVATLPKDKDLLNTKNMCNNLNLANKSNNKDNSGSAEIVAIFTLEDFPELPVPKQIDPWSFQFSQQCKTETKLTNKNKFSTKNESKSNNVHVLKSRNEIELKDTGIDNVIGDNFFIIMDKNSSQSNKHNLKNTTGSTQIKPRLRQISECSDDSFIICFTNDAADGVIELTELSSEDTSCSDSDEDSEYFEECQLQKTSRRNSSLNTENVNTAKKNSRVLSLGNAYQPDSGFDDLKDKKVRFRLEPEIHIMRLWDFAYRAARKGNWENFARDRCRFQNRIANVDPIISTILSKQHREKIFNERFSKNPISITI